MYDAILRSISLLSSPGDTVVLVGDGEDNASRVPYEVAETRLATAGARLLLFSCRVTAKVGESRNVPKKSSLPWRLFPAVRLGSSSLENMALELSSKMRKRVLSNSHALWPIFSPRSGCSTGWTSTSLRNSRNRLTGDWS